MLDFGLDRRQKVAGGIGHFQPLRCRRQFANRNFADAHRFAMHSEEEPVWRRCPADWIHANDGIIFCRRRREQYSAPRPRPILVIYSVVGWKFPRGTVTPGAYS